MVGVWLVLAIWSRVLASENESARHQYCFEVEDGMLAQRPSAAAALLALVHAQVLLGAPASSERRDEHAVPSTHSQSRWGSVVLTSAGSRQPRAFPWSKHDHAHRRLSAEAHHADTAAGTEDDADAAVSDNATHHTSATSTERRRHLIKALLAVWEDEDAHPTRPPIGRPLHLQGAAKSARRTFLSTFMAELAAMLPAQMPEVLVLACNREVGHILLLTAPRPRTHPPPPLSVMPRGR